MSFDYFLRSVYEILFSFVLVFCDTCMFEFTSMFACLGGLECIILLM